MRNKPFVSDTLGEESNVGIYLNIVFNFEFCFYCCVSNTNTKKVIMKSHD